MKIVAILIDFDNIFPRPMNLYTSAFIQRVISFAVNTVRTSIPDVEKFMVRLYGGWYENNRLTSRASAVSGLLPSMNAMFPIIEQPRTIIQGSIELVTQLYGHNFVWYNSYREHYGLPRLRINTAAMGTKCEANKATCPVKILTKFTDKKQRICNTAGCNTVHSNVFFERAQKYVDTLIACDIISLSNDEDVSGIFVMSDDVDHFPAFAVAHDLNQTKAKLGLFITNDLHVASLTSLLSPFEITVIHLQ